MGRAVAGVLAVVALIQLGGLSLKGGPAAGVAEPDPFEAELSAFGLNAGESGLVVLAFHPDCVHCEAVAATWARWTESLTERGVDVVAVTLVSLPDGRAFARDADWVAEVVSVTDQPQLRPLASRTPWIFVYGANGRLAYQGHGQNTGQADRVIHGQTSWREPDV